MASALLTVQTADAFGISPPQVINDRLYPGAHYEQKITLSRTDSDQAVLCKAEINAPGFEKWISIDPGATFTIPQGQRIQVMMVKIDVPKDAKPTRNRGSIKVTVAPAAQEGVINIVLGAQIDVDLTVTSEKVSEFTVKQVRIPDIEIGWKTIVGIKLKNEGNIKNAPDKVVLSVYDSSHKKLIKTVETKKIQKIEPFQTEEVLTFFKVPLALGQYWGEANVYKNGQVIWVEKVIFTVRPKGSLPPQQSEPLFVNVDRNTVIIVSLVGLIIAAVLIYAALRFLKTKKKRKWWGKK